jgi:hypothetical protein
VTDVPVDPRARPSARATHPGSSAWNSSPAAVSAVPKPTISEITMSVSDIVMRAPPYSVPELPFGRLTGFASGVFGLSVFGSSGI